VAFTSTLAIDVVAPSQVFVRGRGIDSEWQADLQVRGALDAPRVTGEIALRRGQFDFLGRRLQLTRGMIRFSGATPPDPSLDIRGESRAAEVTAIVEIGGVVSKPEITLSSEPALPQDEVLARLLFGRDTSRISAAQGLQIAAALRELAGLSSGPGVIDRLRSGIGLDTLDFSTDAGETGVRAGRYLSDEVYVEVQRGVEPGSGRATVEIELTPNLRVQSEVTDRATSGVGLQWRMDY
jgi:translocation and assembly module TamB